MTQGSPANAKVKVCTLYLKRNSESLEVSEQENDMDEDSIT